MRELLDQGVDPDDFEPEDVEYDPGMTDEQLAAAHADMEKFLQDTAPLSIVTHPAPFADGLFDGPDDPALIDYVYQSSEEAALRRGGTMVDVHPTMSFEDADMIFERHGLVAYMDDTYVAIVLVGLEAEIAALQAMCEQYAALLIGERGENARLRTEVARLQSAFSRIASGSATSAPV